jgi:hypothetical protein
MVRTSKPRARRVRTRLQVLLQSSAKLLISASWGDREGGRGCWALPFLKSPKFMALVLGLAFFGLKIWRNAVFLLFEVASLSRHYAVLVFIHGMDRGSHDIRAGVLGRGFLYACLTNHGSIDVLLGLRLLLMLAFDPVTNIWLDPTCLLLLWGRCEELL